MNSTIFSDLKEFIHPKFLGTTLDSTNETISFDCPVERENSEPLNIESNLKVKRQNIEIFEPTLPTLSEPTLSVINPNEVDRPESTNKQLPQWCKQPCSNCKENTQYRINELNAKNGNRRLIDQKSIIQELKAHMHPSSRNPPSKYRAVSIRINKSLQIRSQFSIKIILIIFIIIIIF